MVYHYEQFTALKTIDWYTNKAIIMYLWDLIVSVSDHCLSFYLSNFQTLLNYLLGLHM